MIKILTKLPGFISSSIKNWKRTLVVAAAILIAIPLVTDLAFGWQVLHSEAEMRGITESSGRLIIKGKLIPRWITGGWVQASDIKPEYDQRVEMIVSEWKQKNPDKVLTFVNEDTRLETAWFRGAKSGKRITHVETTYSIKVE